MVTPAAVERFLAKIGPTYDDNQGFNNHEGENLGTIEVSHTVRGSQGRFPNWAISKPIPKEEEMVT